jgi:hypothetical protein
MNDPLKLYDTPTTGSVRLARTAPHPDFERIYNRINNGAHADAIDIRILLLSHLIYVAYRDLKETLAP